MQIVSSLVLKLLGYSLFNSLFFWVEQLMTERNTVERVVGVLPGDDGVCRSGWIAWLFCIILVIADSFGLWVDFSCGCSYNSYYVT